MKINNEKDFFDKYDNVRNFVDITTKILAKNNYQYNENNERILKELNINDLFLYSNININSAYCHAVSQYLRVKRESNTSEVFSLISETIKEGKAGEFNNYSMKNFNCYSNNYMDTTYFTSIHFKESSLFISERYHRDKIFIELGFKHNFEFYDHNYYLNFEFSINEGTIIKSSCDQFDLIKKLKTVCRLISQQADEVNNEV